MTSSIQTPDLNMDKGIEQFGGNESLYLSILEYYISDMQPLLDATKSVEEAGLEGYQQNAHAIKGASQSVFAENLGNEAAKLEQAAKDGDIEYINSNHEAFLDNARKLVQSIETMLATKNNT